MITEQQRQERKKFIGSSDMAAILGIDPWRSAADVFIEKTQDLADVENESMSLGNRLESAVLDYAEDELGPLKRNVFIPYLSNGSHLAANLDGVVASSLAPVEAKTSGIQRGFVPAEAWGDGEDEVPEHVIIQCHVQLICTGNIVCYVPALLGGRGFVMYYVPRNEELVEIIHEKAAEFWDKFIATGTPPPDVSPSLEVVKRIRRQPKKIIDIPATLIQAWRDAKEAEKAATETTRAATAQLLAALGDAEQGNSSLGAITYMEQKRKAYLVKEGVFRVLRFKAKKG